MGGREREGGGKEEKREEGRMGRWVDGGRFSKKKDSFIGGKEGGSDVLPGASSM